MSQYKLELNLSSDIDDEEKGEYQVGIGKIEEIVEEYGSLEEVEIAKIGDNKIYYVKLEEISFSIGPGSIIFKASLEHEEALEYMRMFEDLIDVYLDQSDEIVYSGMLDIEESVNKGHNYFERFQSTMDENCRIVGVGFKKKVSDDDYTIAVNFTDVVEVTTSAAVSTSDSDVEDRDENLATILEDILEVHESFVDNLEEEYDASR
jgi:hypothetical protein